MPKTRLIERDYTTRNRAYGDLKVLSRFLGLRRIPIFSNFELPHGWIIKERNIVPDFVIGSDGLGYKRKHKRLFVARYDQETFLRDEGFTDVHAIGHPIVYLDKIQTNNRIPNSLLIMPAHSLPQTTENWHELDIAYAEFLSEHVCKFSYIALCLHSSDIKKENWLHVKSLVSECIEGADPLDANSYMRMSQLFSCFEYVTTNVMGSNVAYASLFGAKVSVCGPWDFKKEEYVKVTQFKNQPEILTIRQNWHRASCFQRWYPQFYCSPKEAVGNLEWAKWQLGWGCRRANKELGKLLGWGLSQQMRSLMDVIIRKVMKAVSVFKKSAREIFSFVRCFGVGGFYNYMVLVQARNKNGTGQIDSKKSVIFFRNSSTDIDVIWQHFGRRELFGIKYPGHVNNILDLGSNIGISVIVFRSLFPNAKIIAVEINAENFQLLDKNCSADPRVELVNAAIWSENGHVDQVDVGDGEWALRVGNYQGKALGKVPSYTFEKILEKYKVDRVDLCKMDIEGAESDVLIKSWREVFSKTKLLILEIHHWIPDCAESVNGVIEEAQKVFNLSISYSGEFTVIENLDL